jgi:3-oxoacyl-[acyl-carrier protein] reductase
MTSSIKTAIVSGASGYVGTEIAKRLAADGIRVALLYNSASSGKMEDNIRDMNGSGHRVYQCDLADEQSVHAAVESITRDFGRLDACVHAAWTKPKRKKLSLSTAADLREQIEPNLYGSFNLLSTCAAIFKKQGSGVIIGITTESVLHPEAAGSLGAYVAAKFAFHGMLAAFKAELGAANVAVYSVAPGFMEGGMNSDLPKAFVEMEKKKNPSGALIEPKDVAAVVARLCAGDSSQNPSLTFPVNKDQP